MSYSSIEWTDKVWNPTRGCSRVSPGCGGGTPGGGGGCYAERQAYRFHGRGQPYEGLVQLGKNGPRWTGVVRLVPEMLDAPLHWKKPTRVFVNSMSDLFHEALSNEEVAAVFGVMAAAPQHTFQVLTKRAERMRAWFEWIEADARRVVDEARALGLTSGSCRPEDRVVQIANLHDEVRRAHRRAPIGFGPNPSAVVAHQHWPSAWPLPNVWLGVSVEDQQRADERIPHLLATPAAVRFLSCEPLLGPIDLEPSFEHVKRVYCGDDTSGFLDDVPLLRWVITGSESGPGARPMDVAWARSIVDQCKAAGVACFTKQIATPEGRAAGDPKGGDPAHWPGGPEARPRQFPRSAS